MKNLLALTLAVTASVTNPVFAADDDTGITWLVNYDGTALPGAEWTVSGKPRATVEEGALRLVDASDAETGAYRAGWKLPAGMEQGMEIVVDVDMKLVSTTGAVSRKPESQTVWPWRDGAHVGLLVSDGKHQEGLVFYPDRISTWTDRFFSMDTKNSFHTFRLVINGTDMSATINGRKRITGQNAFSKPADDAQPFIQFGSNSQKAKGDAFWRRVRLGVRKAAAPPATAIAKIKLSEPWTIERPDLERKPTRPYVYSAGEGKLLMSVAEGPDAIYEPYGMMKSTDGGKTWTPEKGLDFTEHAPLSTLKLKDGSVLAMSRWTWRGANDAHVGRMVRWDAGLEKHEMSESPISIPKDYTGTSVTITCERRIFENEDGSLFLTGYTRTGPATPEGLRVGKRYSHLVKSTDGGKSWNHFAVIGPGAEPAVAQTGPRTYTALLREGSFKPLDQVFSADGGKTWTTPRVLEEGSVCPDLVMMSNGLLACSYGRPAGCLMFSADGGRTWASHHVITTKTGFNYSGIVEVSPGRLLYVHDGGGLQALYIDVERVAVPKKPTNDYALRTAKELKPTRKIVYKKLPDRELEMHLFEPAGYKPTDKRPCFLAIHGGGWVAGTPDVVYCVADHFAKKGWLGISMQYRIAKAERGTTVFDAVKDGRSAVRYLRAHAAELGIDPDRIIAGGRSAGGHIAASTALFDFDEEGEDTTVSCVPNALVLCSAVLDTSTEGYGNAVIGERWQELSPVHRVRAGLPPTIVLHGIRDTVTPVNGAKVFAEKMKAAGNPCELILHEKGNHSYMMRTEPLFLEAMAQTEAFLKKSGIRVEAE